MPPRTRIAAIIIQDDKLLLQVGIGYANLWTPGGGKEENETDLECLKRELKEEICVELVESKFFKEYTLKSFYHPGQTLIERVYIVKIQGEVKPAAEIESVVWLSKEEYVNKTYPMIPHNEEELIPDLIQEGVW